MLSSSAPERILYEWNFADGIGSWYAAHSVAPLTVREGHLIVAVTGPDPYLHSSPYASFEIEGNARQFISMRARCTHEGVAEWFWAGQIEGRDHGFVAGKEVGFTVRGDGQWHTYNVFPAWSGRITRLRLDPPDLQDVTQIMEIEWVKIVELPPETNPGPAWIFGEGFQGFVPQKDVESFTFGPEGVSLTGFGQPTLQHSDLALEAARHPWISLEAKASQPTEVRLWWRTSEQDFSPQHSLSVAMEATPQPTFYNLLVGNQPGWRGTVTGLRLAWEGPADPHGSVLTLRSLALGAAPRGPAALEWINLKASATVALMGQPITLHGQLRNNGGTVATGMRVGAEVFEGWEVQWVEGLPNDLAPGAAAEVQVSLRSNTPTLSRVTLWATAAEARPAQKAFDFIVSRSLPPIPDSLGSRRVGRLQDGTVALVWGDGALLVPHNPYGYGPAFVLVRGPAGWQSVATIPALGEVIYGDAKRQAMYPAEVSLNTDPTGLPFAQFVARWTDPLPSSGNEKASPLQEGGLERAPTSEKAAATSGVAEWQCRIFLAPRGPGRFQVTSRLSCTQAAALWRFSAPPLLVGDGTTGEAKREALFPGLEYLGPEERSSSDRDIAPPHHLRFAPHPHRITVPVMAVTVDLGEGAKGEGREDQKQEAKAASPPWTVLVALLWDMLQEWAPGKTLPTAVFAVPNFLEDREQHHFSLFVPSIPDCVAENERVARKPFAMEPAQPVKLSAQILVRPQAQVVDAVTAWYALYGFPRPQPAPLPDEKMYALSLRGCEELLYTEGHGWAGVKGWAPGPSPETALLYVLLEAELGDQSPVPNLRQKAIERAYTGYGLPLAFHIGGVEEALLRAIQAAMQALQSRDPQGRWVFRPTESTAALGPAGETVVGIGAGPVNAILNGAARGAKATLLAEGRKGLAFLETFRIPRGAQVWECPLYAPDILAAAQAARAFLWGYRLTGERHYLEQAIYWARTGLPFVYVWQSPKPGLEPMQGGSIPIFGATFFTGSWFGRIVQWNGLEYADVLLDLARYDDTFDWRSVADNLIASGLRQQRTEPEYLGLYPDSWGMIDGSISWGLMLGPQLLARLVLKQRGREPDGHLRLFRSGDHLVTLQTVGNLSNVVVGNGQDGQVVTELGPAPFKASWTVQYNLAETSYAALVGVTRPTGVFVDGQDWPEVKNLDQAGRGWSYSEALGAVILKLQHRLPTGRALVQLEGLDFAVPSEKRQWTFDRSPEGWRALHDVEPLETQEGALMVRGTGSDPFIGSPPLQLEAATVSAVVVRLRTQESGSLQLFWDRGEGFVPEQAATVSVAAGEEFTEAVFAVGDQALWTGTITALRLDPPGGAGNVTAIESIELRE